MGQADQYCMYICYFLATWQTLRMLVIAVWNCQQVTPFLLRQTLSCWINIYTNTWQRLSA